MRLSKVNYNSVGQKQCTKCQLFRDTTEFHKWSKGSDGLKLQCKVCVRNYDLSEDDAKRKKPRKYLDGKMHCRDCKNYFEPESFTLRKSNTVRCDECTIIHQHNKTIKKHGITYEQYEEMLNAQGGVCKICGSEEKSYRSRLCIDHDHSCCPGDNSCGKCIRGIICSNCNMSLGNAKDSIEILQSMIEYLKSSKK